MARKRQKGRKGGKKKYRIEMTSFSIFIWTFILFFLLIWVFVLGIFMGRFYFPGAVSAISGIKEQIGKLPGIAGQSKSAETASPKKETPDPKLAFYDRLSSKKETAQKKTVNVPTVSKKPVTGKNANPEPPARNPSPRPAAKPKPERTVAGAEKGVTPGAGRYTIQLASLELASQAEKLSKKLVNRGFPAYYYDVEIKGKTYYRVRCGRFGTRKEAAAFVKKLEAEAGVKGFVLRMN
jgi:cell division septation protein DedD